MSERRKEIYVSGDVLHSLILIGKSKPVGVFGGTFRSSTADEIGEAFLIERIKKDYPQLLEHQRKVDKMEKEVISSLSTTAGKAPTDAKQ